MSGPTAAPSAEEVAGHLDALLGTSTTPDYPGALNGLQLAARAPVRRIAAAVDYSRRTIDGAIAAGANFLILHHGMFWAGPQRLVGPAYERLRRLVEHDVAVYGAHLPLDAHPDHGNNALLARELGLEPTATFLRYQGFAIGVAGEADVETAQLVARADAFARAWGGRAHATEMRDGRRTRRWAVCTGAGASSEAIREAASAGIDTLVVGEGPHHTAVDAPESGLVIVYAGHYATETLGVRSLAAHASATFGIPWSFVEAPTGT